MSSLLKEFSRGDQQNDLKTSDGSSAGVGDTASKPNDVSFSLMRNMINTDGPVSGSDVNDYLERAHDLNNEVDTVGFAIETDDDDIIKIYVNANQADEFAAELSNLMGLDGDTEAAINTLAQKYDIVDVVWPQDPEGDIVDEPGEDPYAVDIDDDLSGFLDDEDSSADDETPVESDEELPDALPSDDDQTEKSSTDADEKPKKSLSLMKDVAGDEDEESDKEDKSASEDEENDSNDTPSDEGDASSSDEESSGQGPEEISDKSADEESENESEEDETSDETSDEEEPESKKKKKKKDDGENEDEITEEGLEVNPEPYTPKESNMTIGSKFLERVLEAAPSDVALDQPWKGLHSRLKRPYEKKIVEIFSLVGIPGRYVAGEEGIKDAIEAAGDIIRRPGRKQTAFNAFYDGLKSASTVTEAKKRGGRLQKILETVLVTLGLPESMVTVDGKGALATVFARAASKIEADSNLEAALIMLSKALGITSAQVNEAKTVKIKEPGWYVVDHMDKAVAGPFTESGARSEAAEMNIEHMEKHGKGDINPFDFLFFSDYDIKKLKEDVDVGEDDFFQGVVALAMALGIPEKNLQYQRPMMIKSLREKKMSLTNRAMIIQRMAALGQLIDKGTRKTNEPAVQEALTEGFKELEAMDNTDLRKFKVEDPNAGPAMFAAYDGAGAHSETHIVLAADSEIEGGESLYVAVASSWAEKDDIRPTKYFSNDKAGYNQAKQYAEALRSMNPKKGGRPKGWKD